MVVNNNFNPTFHITLKELINEKSKRDNVKFTACQLANALNMPSSVIAKLTHPVASKRVTNPRIDTLVKIINFFREDGFQVCLEDIIGNQPISVDIKDQNITHNESQATIPVYSIDYKKNKRIGVIDINLASKSRNVFCIVANEDISPFFKSGSAFVIDPDLPICHGNLIAIKLSPVKNIQIKKYIIKKKKVILESINADQEDIILMPTTQCEMIGVVIQVNAKT